MANRWLELEKTLKSRRAPTPRTLSTHSFRTWAYARSSTIPPGAVERAKRTEGNIEHLYLDSNGNVTVGVGRMLRNADAAAKLAFVRNADGAAASEKEIRDEFAVVAGKEKDKLASFYKQFTTLHLTKDTIEALLTADLQTAISGLQRDFKDYDTYPTGVQEALIDRAFNLGNAKLINEFPKFVGHIRNRDWKAAARESHRRGIGDARNDEIAKLLNDAA
jgi:GH24 family phage-related lysozyme (muramidase)